MRLVENELVVLSHFWELFLSDWEVPGRSLGLHLNLKMNTEQFIYFQIIYMV